MAKSAGEDQEAILPPSPGTTLIGIDPPAGAAGLPTAVDFTECFVVVTNEEDVVEVVN